ncbi:MAG: transcriptional regulator [Sphingobacteriales bacterium]|nr:transcriptional regulator [Sphingobacteriales bacterium]
MLWGLSKQGFLKSSKGRYGGFLFPKDAKTLADIIIAIDGDKMFKGCGVGLAYCSDINPCPIHNEYKTARSLMYNIYKKTTLNQFTEKNHETKFFLKRE